MAAVKVCFHTYEFGGVDYRIRSLLNRQQYEDDDGEAERYGISSASWPLFGVIWPSGELLASLMVDHDIQGKRILEVGCGLALASMVLSHRLADITATDIYPRAEGFLAENIKLNKAGHIPFVRVGWVDEERELGKYNLIIGSDLLYEPDQAHELARFIEQHATLQCDVLIVDPGRGLHPRFSKNMLKLGFLHNKEAAQSDGQHGKPFRGQVLHYKRSLTPHS
jgi:predicted nicotinamide N-methyase